MTVPTIGRIVHYWPNGKEPSPRAPIDTGQPYMAQIVFVAETTINLLVTNHYGDVFPLLRVPGPAQAKGRWDWPPIHVPPHHHGSTGTLVKG